MTALRLLASSAALLLCTTMAPPPLAAAQGVTPDAPRPPRADSLPPLSPQQQADLLGPGNVQDPLGADETTPAPTGTRRHLNASAAAAAPRYRCTGYSSIPSSNPLAQVMQDNFAWGTYPAAKVGDGSGNINWRANPYRQVSWYMWLHSLRWLGNAIEAGRKGDDAALNHATAVAKDWVRDNPYSWQGNAGAWEATMHRTNVLNCLREVVLERNDGALPASYAWLDISLVQHAEFLRRHYSGWGNHGTDESIVMLGVGCNLRRPDYQSLAMKRLADGLGHAIDSQGATNEQSTGYAVFNYGLWGRAETALTACAPTSSLRRTIAKRRAALGTFIAHAMTPRRTLAQLGNTESRVYGPFAGPEQTWAATGGKSGARPAQLSRVYMQGYVFGRSGWGTARKPFAHESFYSLRFGPARALHGHNDHTSITWEARGKEVLADVGYGEYTRDAWEAYFKGPAAHNQLVVSGMGERFATRLAHARTGYRNADSYRFTDAPASGVSRSRSVLIARDPDLVLVLDQASSRSTRRFEQLWHLPAGTRVSVPASGRAASAVNGPLRTTLVQLPAPGTTRVPAATTRTLSGSKRPIQGWVWPTIFTKTAAPVVSVQRSGRSANIVTAVVAGGHRDTVRGSMKPGPKGSSVYTVTVGKQSVVVSLSASGVFTRVK
ncbi:heparinase II/III domain-containing protein [Gephyromycinifex aptenodytis]|uniref:heparinase II/III domain-containing protein n=1 Tax=Gephyromycinifex aptenodytis TaxID=2716227 RepID=UPI0014457996|nr:heparinase II/III family protein [Gephyromycinifex aptenodytis]